MSLNSTNIAAPAVPASKFFSLEVQDVRLDTADALLVTFSVPEAIRPAFRFEPGQHLILRTVINGAQIRRPYSICAAIQDGALRLAIKRASTGLFSNWAFDHLKPGMVIDALPPTGRFGLPLSTERRHNYLAFAAGSGITPIFSIIKSTLIAEPETQFTLFYGNQSTGSVMLRTELADLKDLFVSRFTLVHVLSRERQESDLLYGRISHTTSRDLLKHSLAIHHIDSAFICGPGTMVEEVRSALLSEGLTDTKIRSELFTAPKNGRQFVPTPLPEHPWHVTSFLGCMDRK